MDQDQKKIKSYIAEIVARSETPLTFTTNEEVSISPYISFLKGCIELNITVGTENRALLTRYLCSIKGFIPLEIRTKPLHWSINEALIYLISEGGV